MKEFMETIRVGDVIKFTYTNHRGVTELREVEFKNLQFGCNKWYPELQYFLYAYCLNRDGKIDQSGYRSFAINQIVWPNRERKD